MSREIKYRAWDKTLKRMFLNVHEAYDTLHCHNLEDLDEWDCGCVALAHDFSPVSFGEVLRDKNLVVMEFTGLRDKNGKRIYEGDVVKNEVGDIFPVKFLYGSFIAKDKPICDITPSADLEVVGNIYETVEVGHV